jgi:mRNA-degrading endonuclease RelE of RelBE toxin-antitoxin system
VEFLEEFRRGVDQILKNPGRWQQLDYAFRRYRLHRFPYGLVYKVISERDVVLIEAVMHLSRRPGFWDRRG